MTNYERYKKEIEHADACAEVGAIAGRICEAGDDCVECTRRLMEWAAADYVPHVTREMVEVAVEIGRYCESREKCGGVHFRKR